MKFVITVEMPERWIPHFRGMLEYMEELGQVGMSREVTFFADGDGDFRTKFEFPEGLPEASPPIDEQNGNRYYDAG